MRNLLSLTGHFPYTVEQITLVFRWNGLNPGTRKWEEYFSFEGCFFPQIAISCAFREFTSWHAVKSRDFHELYKNTWGEKHIVTGHFTKSIPNRIIKQLLVRTTEHKLPQKLLFANSYFKQTFTASMHFFLEALLDKALSQGDLQQHKFKDIKKKCKTKANQQQRSTLAKLHVLL